MLLWGLLLLGLLPSGLYIGSSLYLLLDLNLVLLTLFPHIGLLSLPHNLGSEILLHLPENLALHSAMLGVPGLVLPLLAVAIPLGDPSAGADHTGPVGSVVFVLIGILDLGWVLVLGICRHLLLF